MILFQTDLHEIDLSNLPISFNEKSNYFSNKINKSYSLPFNVHLHEDFIEKLQMVVVNNVVKYKSKIYGTLVLHRKFYEGYISINEVEGLQAELTIFVGKETLAVFDKKLKALPFPVVLALGGFQTFAKNQMSKSWPEATHNFPRVYRPDIKNESSYEYFNLFVNNYNTNGIEWKFIENSKETIDGEEVVFNRNVIAPFPYLLEVVKQIFKAEGLAISGDFVNNPLNHKILMVPKQYSEQFAPTHYLNYSFQNFTSQESINGNTVNVYKQLHTPTAEGSYTLDMRINMSDVIANYFNLTVKIGDITLYEATSQGKEVNIDHTLDINIVNTQVFENIEVELKTAYHDISIQPFNSFKYQFKEDLVNIFPSLYNLANFLPDLKCREFINRIKTCFNLKFDYSDTTVYINYLEKSLQNLTFKDYSHLEQLYPKRDLNKNNLFKISYPDKQEVWVNKEGQTYSDLDYEASEIEKIPIEVLPLKVKENFGFVTAVYPKDDEDIMLVIYDGLQGGYNNTVDNINNETLTLQDNYLKNWKQWLKFRSNSETIKDTFFLPTSEDIDLQIGVFKYNKNHLIKTIERRLVNDKWWEVDIETETL